MTGRDVKTCRTGTRPSRAITFPALPSLFFLLLSLRPAPWLFVILSFQCHLLSTMAKQTTHQTAPNREKNPRRQPTASGEKDASVNRNASHNYFLLEKFEAGVVLTGTEVKSVRTGKTNLKDAYGLIKDGELWLLNCHISPYDFGNYANHAALRTRKLLIHKEEIRKLIGKTQQKGLTLIPTRMYFKNGKIKVELALAKGKQLWDKRETERRRTADKEAREAISRSRKRA
jgi:SsrA-binding protein